MAISYNTGTTADSAGTQATSQAITVPAGVQGGDVVLILAQQVPLTSTPSTFTASSTGTTPTSAGSAVTGTEPLPAAVTGQVFWFAAAGTPGSTSSDAGKVVTITASATGFWSMALVAYTGASTNAPIDVISGAFGGANTVSVTCPVLSTGKVGDWAVFLGGGAGENATAVTAPAGTTTRQTDNSSSQIDAVISDSGGSVGNAGTSIGGGTFNTPAGSTNAILTGFTLGLAASTGSGAEAPVPPRIPHPRFLDILAEAAWTRADRQAQGVADLAVAFSSTAGGIDTYNVTSPYNGGAQQHMRVLNPAAPSASYPHAFLLMLPVEVDQGTTFGDPLAIAQGLNAHNAYNLTCIQPGFAISPWYADNPLDPTVWQETFLLKLLTWIRANLATNSATAGAEKFYLIGFSKSGIGGQSLQFRHPDLFAATASWDAPFGMTDYDGTDPNGAVGGGSAAVYGTSSNFTTHYALSAFNLANWKATGQYAVNRIWIGAGPSFTADVAGYNTALATAGIPHAGTFINTGDTHAWDSDWVAAALAAIIPPGYPAPAVLPQQVPRPFLTSILSIAALRIPAAAPPVPPVPGTATLAGAGSLGTAAVQGATAALGAAGSLSTAATQGAIATLAAAGSLGTAAAQSATASLAGTGSLATAAVQGATAALAGSGSVTASAGGAVQGTAALAGAGSLTAAGGPAGAAALAAAGSLASVPAAQGAAGVLPGTGSVTAAGGLRAGAALAAAGAVTTPLLGTHAGSSRDYAVTEPMQSSPGAIF